MVVEKEEQYGGASVSTRLDNRVYMLVAGYAFWLHSMCSASIGHTAEVGSHLHIGQNAPHIDHH